MQSCSDTVHSYLSLHQIVYLLLCPRQPASRARSGGQRQPRARMDVNVTSFLHRQRVSRWKGLDAEPCFGWQLLVRKDACWLPVGPSLNRELALRRPKCSDTRSSVSHPGYTCHATDDGPTFNLCSRGGQASCQGRQEAGHAAGGGVPGRADSNKRAARQVRTHRQSASLPSDLVACTSFSCGPVRILKKLVACMA